MNGLEMMLKTFGLDPDQIRKNVVEFQQLVLRLATSMERVEAQQHAIMDHLGIHPVASTEQSHGNGQSIVNTDSATGSTAR
jgi:hypothetical protein